MSSFKPAYMESPELQSIKQRFGIIGHSPKLLHAIQIAAQVAPTDLTVLITGESGSGKESFSKIIHQLSRRRSGEFIAINCGAIPEGTIDSELFGHEKGSFTGATDARKGYFEVTNGGTIFLDEIAEMPLGTQARLLRVLENKEFIRVGSSKVQKTDVRVVAATNVELYDRVRQGKFREDLYFRLNTVPLIVPPLRERGQDIELLFRKFASDFAEQYRMKPLSLDEDAKRGLLAYRFPGNIRQLKNIAEQMSILETDRQVSLHALLKYLPDYHSQASQLPTLTTRGRGGEEASSERDILYKVLFELRHDVTELKQIVSALVRNDGSAGSILHNSPIFREHVSTPSVPATDASYLLPSPSTESSAELRLVEPGSNAYTPTLEDDEEEIENASFKVVADESLSLEKKEKEMILRALQKNKNKRRLAAQDLGISERTLYRKIRQYDLE